MSREESEPQSKQKGAEGSGGDGVASPACRRPKHDSLCDVHCQHALCADNECALRCEPKAHQYYKRWLQSPVMSALKQPVAPAL